MLKIWFFLLVPFFVSALQNCQIPENLSQGYAVLYYLSPQTTENLDVDSLYELDTLTPWKTVYGISDLDFYIADTNTVGYSIYGVAIQQVWFNLQMVGYFVPPTTGYYTFTITGADDQVLVRLGDGIAFTCCTNGTGSAQEETLYTNGRVNKDGTGNIEATYFIPSGYSFPIKISYSNMYLPNPVSGNAARLGFQITDSSGNDVSEDVYYVLNDSAEYCPAGETTTTVLWTGESTKTILTTMTITTGTIVYTTSEVIVQVPTTAVDTLSATTTVTETVTVEGSECSDTTITEWVTFATGTQLTIFTLGSVEGTSTYFSCATMS